MQEIQIMIFNKIKDKIAKNKNIYFGVGLIIVLLLFVFGDIACQKHYIKDKQKSIVKTNKVGGTIIASTSNSNQDKSNIKPSTEQVEWKCLKEDEEAEYPLEKGSRKKLGIPQYPLTVFVKDKDTGKEIFNFQIDNIRDNMHPVELHKCGVYVIKVFNYNPKKAKHELGYKAELWKYDYAGNEKSIILLAEKPKEFISYYSSDFRVDPLERYVVLERGYMGKDNYALVIKDLKTKEDVFTLTAKDLFKQNPELKGVFDFREWTKDSRYFWGAISAGAIVPGFFRIDTKTWQYEIFSVPEWIGGGDQLNVETGWVTYHTDMVWTGVYQINEEIKKEHREKGIGTKFYIYNLFTKKKILIYETDEPLWFTGPEWLSNTKLEYKLPNGEKRIYRVE